MNRYLAGVELEPRALVVPEALVERIADRAAETVLARLNACTATRASAYLTVGEAATYLRCKPQRVYDLCSARRLTRYKDGSRVLVLRAEIDAGIYKRGSGYVIIFRDPNGRMPKSGSPAIRGARPAVCGHRRFPTTATL